MTSEIKHLNRRQFMQVLGMLGTAVGGMPLTARGTVPMLKKTIPSSGEQIPVIGMGSSRTFDVGADVEARARLTLVLQSFFDQGGSVIDTSPMYGTSEQLLGDLLAGIRNSKPLFMATKVWTEGREEGIVQMQESMSLLRTPIIDLVQVHNLLDWETQMETLMEWKSQGRIRYIGITTHRGYNHDQLVHVMENHPLDFIQFSYNIANRKAEERILPLAAERGIATMVNRPFQRGELFQHVRGKKLPAWVKEFDCHSWGQFFLKFVVSHAAVTCTIPATSKVNHMRDNMGAGLGRMPDKNQRQRMLEYFALL
ncbi:MAG: aldo/keto reductase [Arenicellales bacterium]